MNYKNYIIVVLIIVIILLSFICYKQNIEIKDLEQVLEQCSERYYELIKE